jgi:hypothetical protein
MKEQARAEIKSARAFDFNLRDALGKSIAAKEQAARAL